MSQYSLCIEKASSKGQAPWCSPTPSALRRIPDTPSISIHSLTNQPRSERRPDTEEAKLKAKYPSLGQKLGGSDFLMKRLQKEQKYFDSGDYNMAKAKMKNKQLPSAGPDKNLVTGDHIPTPQDLPQRKSSLVTSKLSGQPEPPLLPFLNHWTFIYYRQG
ncbi:hypothetical protein P7K49_020530 [Saguinus oedipus]|uniref:Alpha-endosulfine n=1 Tax=Saguinus oedipus TaxID=9490 RepID=A0ABQ9V2E5_SAGOE|nr:hypothetical protein P7K49_020530 [Saguinus oedipus]